MKLCMMSCMMHEILPERIVRAAVACQMDAIDWVCSHQYASAKTLRMLSLDNGLKIVAHTISGSRFVRRVSDALDDFKRSIDFAYELDAPMVMLPPFPRVDQRSMEDDRKAWIDFYAQTLPFAQTAGITLSLESTGYANSPITTAAEVLEVLRAVPGLKCTLDVGNMATAGSALDAYSVLKEDVVHFHLKDWKISDHPFPGAELKRCGKYFANAVIGDGNMDLKAFWDTVDSRGRQLYVNLETSDYPGTSSPEAVLKKCCEKLRKW